MLIPRRRLTTHRVPDLQLHVLVVDLDHASPKLHANRQVVHGLEALVRELQQQARLAHARVPCSAHTAHTNTQSSVQSTRQPQQHDNASGRLLLDTSPPPHNSGGGLSGLSDAQQRV